jgi:hypothetical protein
LFFYFALEYAIKKVQENQVGLKLIGTYHLLAFADDVNLFEGNTNTLEKSREAIIDDSKEVSLDVNTERTKYTMLLSRHQNAGQNHNIKIGNRSFENMAKVKYLGTTIQWVPGLFPRG